MMRNDHYGLLGVPCNATAEELAKAYRRVSLKHHPDKGGSLDQWNRVHTGTSPLFVSTKNPVKTNFKVKKNFNK